jgi:hypothetical protein
MMVQAVGTRRPRLLGSVLLILTFLVGALAGAAFQQAVGARELDDRSVAAKERDGRVAEGDIFDRIGVSPEQRAEIDRILEHRREELDAFWAEAGPRLRAITEETREEVKALLTPEQRETFNRLRAERKAMKERHHGGVRR